MSQGPLDKVRGGEAVLFGIVPHGDERNASEALRELQLLADTGDFEVAGCLVQHRRHPDPNLYLGAGKLDELAEICKQVKPAAVICDDPLSPAQGRAVEKVCGVPVLDRSELILHIFGTHARTTQARLQVELAALQYQMPRLKRLWTHLERQRGGIGMRAGAGEKQIDVDRSLLRQRIASVGAELRRIGARKSREIQNRPDLFSVALVGYTNAGKSSLMNRLTSAEVLAQDRLFSTLDTRTRPWRLAGGRTVLLSDTVGFIKKLPHQLVASFHATLEEALHADLLLVVVDGSDPSAVQQLSTVQEVLARLDADHLPQLTVINKLDLVDDQTQLAEIYSHDPRAVQVSAHSGHGIPGLVDALQAHLAGVEQVVEVLIPHRAGALRAEIRARASVLSELFTEQGSLMQIQASPALLGQLLARGAEIPTPPQGDS